MLLHDWKKPRFNGMHGIEALKEDFEISDADLEGAEILFGSYALYDYGCGDAFVLFRRDGKLYEVNGSHCSCWGLEEQWKPEETSIQALLFRLNEGRLGDHYSDGGDFADELRTVLKEISIPS